MRILITSVGSLVGQNILDTLDGRREGVVLIGTNTLGASPNLYRCDRALRSPPAAEAEAWISFVQALIRREEIDLVLPARDDDILLLSRLRDRCPEMRRCITCGPAELAEIMEDKWRSFRFAQELGLPFARTARAGTELEALVAEAGFPLLAKPPAGNGSRGVHIIHTAAQLAAATREPGLLFQEYLAPNATVHASANLCEHGSPLFHAPPYTQLAAQAVISPEGEVRALFCGEVTMVMGRCERSIAIHDADLEAISRQYAEAFAAKGWAGSFNMQGRRSAAGEFKVYELNGRIAGASATRLLLGFDEVSLLAELFAGQALAPSPRGGRKDRIVHKSLTDFVIEAADLARFESEGEWRKP